jgi:hypothetical protein
MHWRGCRLPAVPRIGDQAPPPPQWCSHDALAVIETFVSQHIGMDRTHCHIVTHFMIACECGCHRHGVCILDVSPQLGACHMF